jgi:hypothetical protein
LYPCVGCKSNWRCSKSIQTSGIHKMKVSNEIKKWKLDQVNSRSQHTTSTGNLASKLANSVKGMKFDRNGRFPGNAQPDWDQTKPVRALFSLWGMKHWIKLLQSCLLEIQSQVCAVKLTSQVYLMLLESAAFLMPLDSIK